MELQELRRLAEEAAAECEEEGDWFDPELVELDEPIDSSRKARRFIAAMTPQMALRLIALADRVAMRDEQQQTERERWDDHIRMEQCAYSERGDVETGSGQQTADCSKEP